MIKIGMLIGDRYEILEKIGTGGMSDVYKAKCHKLNRFVAVKVLKQEFGENENFVSKFKVEAQAAAGLMHPNIVNVYDVGNENGINYIVMELVEGITLKKYIEKKARLSVKEAISIAIQVSMGIEAAHNNHIIHRDIKPQNIIISKDGKVKVTGEESVRVESQVVPENTATDVLDLSVLFPGEVDSYSEQSFTPIEEFAPVADSESIQEEFVPVVEEQPSQVESQIKVDNMIDFFDHILNPDMEQQEEGPRLGKVA